MDLFDPEILQNIAKFLNIRGFLNRCRSFVGELFASFEPVNRTTKEVVNEVRMANVDMIASSVDK